MMHDASASDGGVGGGFGAAVMLVGDAIMIEAELVEDCGMEVWDTHAVDARFVAEFIGCAMYVAGFESAAGEEQTEGVAVVVAAVTVLRDG